MSIYRNAHRTPPNAILDFAERADEPAAAALAPEGAYASRRKANPANVLFSATTRWLETLPPNLKPSALCGRFPRIANALASEWSDPEMTRAYFDELVLGSRADRDGFPRDVLCELLALQTYYESGHPQVDARWHDVSLR